MQHGDFRWKLKSGDILFFLHIPKTAGTTIYSMIQSRYQKSQVLILPDQRLKEYLNKTSPEDFQQYRFCRQHFSYDYYLYFPRKLLYMTMLRNPVDRVISFYRHIKRVKTHELHDEITRKNISLGDFIQGYAKNATNNLQVKMLLGSKYFQGQPSTDDLLNIAKLRLKEFAFFGLQEFFDESIKLLGYTFHWGNMEYKSLNIAPKNKTEQTVSDDIYELILKRNALDYALYRYAESLFKQRYERMLLETDNDE